MELEFTVINNARPLGTATTIHRHVVRDALSKTANPPCDGCTACCKAGLQVELLPWEAARLPHEKSEDGTPILPLNPDGSCVMLVNDRCSIYAERPAVCRRYDCRVFALAGVMPTSLLDQKDFRPFAAVFKTRRDRVLFVAIHLATFFLMKQGHDCDIAAMGGVLSDWRKFEPLAEQFVAELERNPDYIYEINDRLRQMLKAPQDY